MFRLVDPSLCLSTGSVQTQDDRPVQACYQHACLLYENGEVLTNQSLRDRLAIGKNNAAVASLIISDTIAAGLITFF